MKKYLSSLLLMVCTHLLVAQNSIVADSSVANLQLDQAQKAMANGKYDSAVYFYHLSGATYHQLEDWESYVVAQNGLSKAYLRNRKLDSMLYYARHASQFGLQKMGDSSLLVADAYYLTGVAHSIMGDLEKGYQYFLSSLDIYEKDLKNLPPEVNNVYNGIGIYFLNRSHYKKALNYYQQALNINLKTFGTDHRSVASNYNNIGIVYNHMGSFDLGLEYYMKALAIRQRINPTGHPDIAMSFNNIGNTLHRQGKYNQALEYYDKGRALMIELYGEEHPRLANSYIGLGLVYESKGDFDVALTYFTKALVIQQQRMGETNPVVAYTHSNLAELYLKMSQDSLAQLNYQNAIDILEKSDNRKNAQVASYYNGLAEIESRTGSASEALELIERAIESNWVEDKNHKGEGQSVGFNQYLDPNILLASWKLKADVLNIAPSKDQRLEMLKIYQKCDSLIKYIRGIHQKHEDKISLSESARYVYEKALVVCVNLYEDTGDINYLNLAFKFSENSKGAVLSSGISANQAVQYADIPDSLKAKDEELKIELSFYYTQKNKELIKEGAYDTSKLVIANERIFSLNRKREKLTELLETSYPQYFELKYQKNQMDISDVQQLIEKNTAFLEYFIGDSTIYIFVLNSAELKVYSQPMPNDLSGQVSDLRRAIINQNFESFSLNASNLYQILIEPIEDHFLAQQLIIVPDGPLWYVNFDILLSAESSSVDYRKQNYLMNKYAISYAYSAELLGKKSKGISRQRATKDIIAFSYSAGESENLGDLVELQTMRNSTADLPGTREEIRMISELLEGDYYYGNFANETNFKANAKDYSIIHLAVHGEVNEKYPMLSQLRFTVQQDSLEDGLLQAHELYNMSLNTDLTVLSACNTGTGQMAKGEGVMSLGRAFTYAGCKSLVLTQWAVPDETSPIVMKNFYSGLKDGLSKDVALQQAKLQYLKNASEPLSSPVYWGGFVLLGDTDSIDLQHKHWSIYVLALAVIFGGMYITARLNKLPEEA